MLFLMLFIFIIFNICSVFPVLNDAVIAVLSAYVCGTQSVYKLMYVSKHVQIVTPTKALGTKFNDY